MTPPVCDSVNILLSCAFVCYYCYKVQSVCFQMIHAKSTIHGYCPQNHFTQNCRAWLGELNVPKKPNAIRCSTCIDREIPNVLICICIGILQSVCLFHINIFDVLHSIKFNEGMYFE